MVPRARGWGLTERATEWMKTKTDSGTGVVFPPLITRVIASKPLPGSWDGAGPMP